MTTIIKKHKEKLPKESRKRYQNLSEEENKKGHKKPETDIKMYFLKKKKKKSISIIANLIKIFMRNKSKSKLRNYYLAHKK